MLQADPKVLILRAEALWREFAQANAALQAVNPLAGLPDAGLYVIYEVHCAQGEAQEVVFAALEAQFESGVILDAVVAQSGQQAADIWAVREDTLSMQSAWPHAVWFDVSVPELFRVYGARFGGGVPALMVNIEKVWNKK